MHVGIEAADPGPHDFGQRAWQGGLDAGARSAIARANSIA